MGFMDIFWIVSWLADLFASFLDSGSLIVKLLYGNTALHATSITLRAPMYVSVLHSPHFWEIVKSWIRLDP